MDHGAALLPDGEVLVAGGIDVIPGSGITSAEIYDPQSDTWRPAASMHSGHSDFTLISLADGRVLAAGGEGSGPTALSEVYDPILDVWKLTAPMSAARWNYGATLLPSGEVLVCGGFQTSVILASCERFDPLSGLWHPAAPMIWAAGNTYMSVLASGKVLMTVNFSQHVGLYDPIADTWTEVAPMPEIRESFSSALLPSGRLLVAGGRIGPALAATAEFYDPDADSWTPTTSMSVRRAGGKMIVLQSGEALVFGGNFVPPDAEIFDPASETWRSAGGMIYNRNFTAATRLDNGDVLVAGGGVADPDLRPVADVERYLAAGANVFLDIGAEPEPSLVGQPYLVTVTASARSGTPSGSIVASDPFGASCGPVALVDGVATCELVAGHDGPHQITATYTSDSPYFEDSSGSVSHDVVEADTHLSIVSHTPEPSLPGEPVTITVDFGVNPPGAGSPHGAIFVDDGVDNCQIPEGETSCTLAPVTRGPITLTANYGGDGDYNPSSDSVTHHVNDLPVAAADAYQSPEDTPLIIAASEGVLANDFDPDGDPLFVTTVGLLPVDGIGGSVEMSADGSFTYAPPPDANGSASFGYAVSDGLEEAFGIVTIVVGAVNDPPQFVLGPDPSLPAGSEGEYSIESFAQATSMGPPDEDDQSVLAWHVRRILDANGVLTSTPSIAPDGTLEFSLSGHGGVTTIGVKLQDDGGTQNGGDDTSSERTFTITVAAGADLSIFVDDGVVFASGGDVITYQITAHNSGPDASSARAQATLSSNLVDAIWTCTPFGGARCGAGGSGEISDIANLPAGASVVYELTATVLADPELPAEVDATIASLSGVKDFNPLNDSATDIDVVGIFADGFDTPAIEDPPTATRTR